MIVRALARVAGLVLLCGCAASIPLGICAAPPKLSGEQIDSAQGLAVRSSYSLILKIHKGEKEYTDIPCDVENANPDVEKCRQYRLVKYVAAADIFIIIISFYEGEGYLILDRKSGRELFLTGWPVFNPDYSIVIATQGSSKGEAPKPNQIELWQKNVSADFDYYWEGRLKLSMQDDLHFCVVEWANNENVSLIGFETSIAGKMQSFPASVIWNGWYWVLAATPRR